MRLLHPFSGIPPAQVNRCASIDLNQLLNEYPSKTKSMLNVFIVYTVNTGSLGL